MEYGDLVRVRLYGGEEVVRRFLAKRKCSVVVCCEAEFQRSLKESRDPDGIGFPPEDILGRVDPRAGVKWTAKSGLESRM